MAIFTNLDGLTQRYGTDRASDTLGVNETGSLNRLVVKLSSAAGGVLDDDGASSITTAASAYFRDENTPFLPAKSYITRAYFHVTTAFTGTTAALTIGLMQSDGTVVDIDAIDAGVGVASLAANAVVACDGAAVGGAVLTSATLDTYVCFTEDNSNAFTAGAGTLVIEYYTLD